jgi:predicted RNase H-like HicB family nuclease
MYTAVFQRIEEGGFYATIQELPEVQTEGDTLQEAGQNLTDALCLVLTDRLERQLRSVDERKESGPFTIVLEE